VSYLDDLDVVLGTFQWAYPNRDENRGELSLDRSTTELVLCIAVNDHDSPDDDVLFLEGRCPVNFHLTPQENVRAAIHAFLCHEADEQMWFEGERIFHPHRVATSLNNGATLPID